MTKIIAVTNQKGGVGKTTTAVNLAAAFAMVDKKVLIIDLDPQGNASTSFGINIQDRKNTIYEVLTSNISINSSVSKTSIKNLFIVSANINLAASETELSSLANKELILKNKINNLTEKYEYIIIDCPPSLGLLSINCLTAAGKVLIPMQCEFFSLEGLSHLLNIINIVKKKLNPLLDIVGIVLTMYDNRNRLTEEVRREVKDNLGEALLDTVIPRNVKISEAPSYGKPVLIYDHKCKGSIAYIELAKEILNRC